ncbi:MAG: ABC transporter substrate-binding protein [Burkholderiales bacterium]|nr:ABC transporter substrate-binding protein [Burkholderiales bacterium]
MDRRKFIGTLAGGLFANPLAASAQQAGTIRNIGWLDLGSAPSTTDSSLEAFRRGLRELGWIEGRNVVIEARYANDDLGRLATVAAELVGRKVDVIVTITTPAALAAKKATSSIPIVMAGSSRPVELGLVESLARPGNNVTGVTNNPGAGVNQKVVQLLKEAAPNVSRVALLWGGTAAPGEAGVLAQLQAVAPALGISILSAEAIQPSDVPAALAAISWQRSDGLYVLPSSTNTAQRKLIVDFALANRVPSIFADARWVRSGGLMSYGIDWLELRRHSATYVDKILRGAKPSDLPVEQPTKFELVINRKTAETLGLTIPKSLQLADFI